MAMKRIPRHPEKFDALELFSAISRHQGYKIGVGTDVEDFKRRIADSLTAALANANMLHGKRVEAMFAHVLGALGGCQFIKQEDSGAAFGAEDLEIPDYRVITNDGALLLVEVKNFYMKDFKSRFQLKRSYLKKLQNYADLNRAALKIAVYWSRINKWLLLSPGSFIQDGRNVYIDLPHGAARNEMSSLGDRMIATLPPLTLELIGDPLDENAWIQEDSTATFTAREARMKCAGKIIRDEKERNMAFYFFRNGNWSDFDSPAQIVDGRVVGIEINASSDEPQDDQPFRVLGDLSSMVSSAFRDATVDDKGIVSLDVKYDPSFFQVDIPQDYKGKDLPLWQFELKPNPEFRYEAPKALGQVRT
jgi:hypothetical protein